LSERETAGIYHLITTPPDFTPMAYARDGFMSEESVQKTDPPPKQSVIAAVGGVLGLLSLFIGVFAALPAVILGHIALVQVGRSSGRLTGTGLAIFALITGYITIAILVFHIMNRG
jgi:membrane-associated protease RseP (regulator of RpoE activity)